MVFDKYWDDRVEYLGHPPCSGGICLETPDDRLAEDGNTQFIIDRETGIVYTAEITEGAQIPRFDVIEFLKPNRNRTKKGQ